MRHAWLTAYTATWTLTLSAGALVAIDRARLGRPVRRLLDLSLSPEHNPPPNIAHVLVLLVHNLPLAAWPLLLGVVGAHSNRLTRSIADVTVVGWLAANVLPVGAALGAYGSRLLIYLPQVPFEWAALALGAGAWIEQRHGKLATREGVVILGLIGGALLCAATLETVTVPHR